MVSMNSKSSPSSLCSNKAGFTRRFLRALVRINKDKPTSSSSHHEICKRGKRIKIAADASMASAVGPRRAWSRVMLWKLRNRTRYRSLIWSRVNGLKRKKIRSAHNHMGNKQQGSEYLSRADRLRQLVPGGEAMDFCNLLDEAAHYIKCLNTQVQVMRNIADLYSP